MTVYFIKAKNKDIFKIGYTSGDPEDRLRQIQTNCPYELEVFATLKRGDMATEKKLHWQLRGHCINGEWFRLTESKVLEILLEYDIKANSNWHKVTSSPAGTQAKKTYYVNCESRNIYVPLSHLPQPLWTIYALTSEQVLSFGDDLFLNICEIEKDFPQYAEIFESFKRSIYLAIEKSDSTWNN